MRSPTAVASPSLDLLCVNTIRTLAIDAVQKANSGHPGMPMGAAAMAYTLWTRHLRFNPRNPDWVDRDRFVLSAGHGSMLLYALLFLTGYDLTLDDLKQFRQWGSKTPGHPERGHTAGVEVTTGPLGQGVGNAVGLAMAERILSARFNNAEGSIVDHRTYVIASDGDMMEGVASEASSLAGHLQLGRLIVLYDDNLVSLDGPTSLSFTNEDVQKRYDAYGWHTQFVADGNDIDAIDQALVAAKADPRPSLIRVRTHIGYGAPHKQDTSAAHGEPLGADEVRAAKLTYGWDPDAQFLVPDDALAHFRSAIARGAELESKWRAAFDAYQSKRPALAKQFLDEQAGKLASGWADTLPVFKPEDGAVATRDASQKAINALALTVPALIGGAADLATSNKTSVKDCGDFEPTDYAGRNLRFGVREHAMGAALTGMAVHGGLRPYGGTFLIFSDYMRPTIRLAALQGANPIYVWTHDSIGLGEDGPTHQSIEQVASLRAIPNMTMMRPADANEAVICWRIAVEHKGGPVGMAFTRQKLPVYAAASVAGAARGGYTLARESGGDLRVILIGTGSEVHVCMAARDLLQKDGIPTRVVSLPCWSIFDAQESAYRDDVLPPTVHARVAVEAASVFGWERYVGDRGAVIGMHRFGASAPAETLFKEFGFTPERVAERARSLL
ncbi:MAG TPA: transketolase [Candidatus Eremiobacteraceae bacterium]|nr:transketolase [Candidatus Eremiobacteraceae bacterium]